MNELNISNQPNVVNPVRSEARIQSLDVLRGIAILGILVMNIQSFSMIQSAYMNPTSFGDLTGMNKLVYIVSHVFTDQKFMTIFSMLYGAGILLITSKAEQKGVSSVKLHYKRTFWLLVIGAVHGYLLWYGDILFTYAMCAMVVFWVRKFHPVLLVVIALIFITLVSSLWVLSGAMLPLWPQAQIEETVQNWKPDQEMIQQELDIYQGPWIGQLKDRATVTLMVQTVIFMFWTFWRVSGCMMLGMAFYKWRLLTAQRSYRFYLAIMTVNFAIGFPLILSGHHKNFSAGWEMSYSMFRGAQYNYWGSLFVAIGYICLVMILCKLLHGSILLKYLANVGRMALSNYLFQTVMGVYIFYGYGLGFFGQVERQIQIFIVAIIWLLQIAGSNLWMSRFRFGPAEWLWRSLTYWRRQPMILNSLRE